MNINILLFHTILHIILKFIYYNNINYYNIKLNNLECILYCEDLYQLYRDYYHFNSKWSYIYAIFPKKYNKVDLNKCDFLYH